MFYFKPNYLVFISKNIFIERKLKRQTQVRESFEPYSQDMQHNVIFVWNSMFQVGYLLDMED